MTWRVAILFLATACGQAVSARPADTTNQVELHFFDVRQGDAALIVSPNRQHVLVDAGPSPTAVAARLRAMRVDTVDLSVASHAHADHIGGMAAIVRGFPVRFYMDNGRPHTTQTYERLLAAVEASRAVYLEATPRTIDLRGGGALRVLPVAPDARDQNDQSVGLLLTFGEFTALFTGDAEHAARRHWLATSDLPRVSLLKVAHHGAENGTDSTWLAAVRPCVAVISVGPGNRYGHPAPRTLALLELFGARVFRTDVHGDIVVTARRDGRMLVRSARTDSASIKCAA
jgi:competence protein ComEC